MSKFMAVSRQATELDKERIGLETKVREGDRGVDEVAEEPN